MLFLTGGIKMGLEINGTNFVASSSIGKTSSGKKQSTKEQHPPLMDPEALVSPFWIVMSIENKINELLDSRYPNDGTEENKKQRESYRAVLKSFFKMTNPEYKAWVEWNEKIFNRLKENQVTDKKGINKNFELIS